MLTASRTATLASGEKPDRAALYQEVADLVAAGGIADAAAIAETTVRIAGLGAELLQDERTLKDRCGRFGEVLEATVYAPWSLVRKKTWSRPPLRSQYGCLRRTAVSSIAICAGCMQRWPPCAPGMPPMLPSVGTTYRSAASPSRVST